MPSGLLSLWRAGRNRQSALESINNPNYRRRGVVSEETKRARRAIAVAPPRLESVGQDVTVGPRLAPARSWVCQYQTIKINEIANCPADVVVIDSTPDGARENFFKPADLEVMRNAAAGAQKKIIGYMSIGEAEYCRFYWHKIS